MTRQTLFIILLGALAMSGCASASTRSLPHPLIEPSAHLRDHGELDDDAVVRTCRRTVLDAAPVSIQPRWLPPILAPNGVLVATAHPPKAVHLSDTAYRQQMAHCLSAQGYDILGWE
jgi:hypothetical protein